MKRINKIQDLIANIDQKKLQDIDLSEIPSDELEGFDFSNLMLSNVIFSKQSGPKKSLNRLIFINTCIQECEFGNAELAHCSFTHSCLYKSSFKESIFYSSRFRDAVLSNIDFRYNAIYDTSFENGSLILCDFYRAHFKGINIFIDSRFVLCSLNHCFFETSCITKKNFLTYKQFKKKTDIPLCSNIPSLDEQIQQQIAAEKNKKMAEKINKQVTERMNEKEKAREIEKIKESIENQIAAKNKKIKTRHKAFLIAEDDHFFNLFINEPFINNTGKKLFYSDKYQQRYTEAAKIYRLLSAEWESKGFFGDARWAFVRTKRCERRQYALDIKKKTIRIKEKPVLIGKWIRNALVDLFLGYGTNAWKLLLSYCLLFLIFAFIYSYINWNSEVIPRPFIMALKSMIGLTNPVEGKGKLVEMLSFIQTSLGILLTGFLGYIIADKIRKS